jgi:hypothetical protein
VVVTAEVVVVGVRGQHVPHGGDDRVFDRDEGFESADAAGEALVAGADEGGVLGSGGGHGRGAEGLVHEVLAVEPAVHRAWVGKSFAGIAFAERHRYGEREQRGKTWYPLLFLVHGLGGAW